MNLLTTRAMAARLSASEDYVREHAAEFGAIRLGGPRSPLRFDPERVEQALERRRLTYHEPKPEPEPKRRPGPRRVPEGVELLPLPDDVGRAA